MTKQRFTDKLRAIRESIVGDDVRAGDWFEFFGESFEEYTNPVDEGINECLQTQEHVDRNDLLRPLFNEMTLREDGTRDPQKITEFYSSDFLSRVIAHEMGKNDWISRTLASLYVSWEREPQHVAVAMAEECFGSSLKILDHGFGLGTQLMGMYVQHLEGEFYATDYKISARSFALTMLRKYLDLYAAPLWIAPENALYETYGPFHVINSAEVMEHLPDPVAEVNRLSSCLVPGGFLCMSTFFNSCDGKDPQHLECNDKFQENQIWFDAVRAAGLVPFANDPRGVLKVWQKEVRR